MIAFDPQNGCAGDMIIAAMTDLGVEGACDFANGIMSKAGAEGDIRAERYRDGTRLVVEIRKDITDFDAAYASCLNAKIAPQIRDFAKRTIDQMINFEREIHGERFHLHELGSVDTLVDVFTCAYCLHEHGFDAASLPISVGSGKVRTAHGLMENPPPLSRKLLESRRFPFKKKEVNFEMATPTGIAILASLAPLERIEGRTIRTGKGYGSAGIEGHDNFLLVHEVQENEGRDSNTRNQHRRP